MTKRELLRNWRNLICSRSNLIDPEGEYIWEALFVGMAIAYGFEPEKARNIYNTEGIWLENQL